MILFCAKPGAKGNQHGPAARSGGGWTYTSLHDFDLQGSDGGVPYGSVALDASGNVFGFGEVNRYAVRCLTLAALGVLLAVVMFFAPAARAQTFSTVFDFDKLSHVGIYSVACWETKTHISNKGHHRLLQLPCLYKLFMNNLFELHALRCPIG